jgi:hypothetical protein
MRAAIAGPGGRRDAFACLGEVVDHVGVAVAGESEQERRVGAPRFPAYEIGPAPVARVVGVHDERAVDVDEERGVLIEIGNGTDADARAEGAPLPVGHDLDAVAVVDEKIANAAAGMIGQEHGLVAQLRERRHVQMIGMSVRHPHERCCVDRRELLGRDLGAEAPAPVVRAALEPGVRCKHWIIVVRDERRVADGVESQFHGPDPDQTVRVKRNMCCPRGCAQSPMLSTVSGNRSHNSSKSRTE